MTFLVWSMNILNSCMLCYWVLNTTSTTLMGVISWFLCCTWRSKFQLVFSPQASRYLSNICVSVYKIFVAVLLCVVWMLRSDWYFDLQSILLVHLLSLVAPVTYWLSHHLQAELFSMSVVVLWIPKTCMVNEWIKYN